MSKPVSRFFSHVQHKKIAPSINLLTQKLSFKKTILFLCCQIFQVKEIYQIYQCCILTSEDLPKVCWRNCCLGVCRNASLMFIQDIDSYQSSRISLPLKNRCAMSASLFLQNRHIESILLIFLLRKFIFVGNMFRINLQAKKEVLLGIFNFHISLRAPS